MTDKYDSTNNLINELDKNLESLKIEFRKDLEFIKNRLNIIVK